MDARSASRAWAWVANQADGLAFVDDEADIVDRVDLGKSFRSSGKTALESCQLDRSLFDLLPCSFLVIDQGAGSDSIVPGRVLNLMPEGAIRLVAYLRCV